MADSAREVLARSLSMMVAGDPEIGADVVLTALNMAGYEVVEPTEDIDEIMAAWRAFRPEPARHPAACRCGVCAKRSVPPPPTPPVVMSPEMEKIVRGYRRALAKKQGEHHAADPESGEGPHG